jgi:Zn-finger nucleic acid-binding protein
MKDTERNTLEPAIEAAEEAAEAWLDSEAIAHVKRALQDVTAKLPEGMSLTFNCELDVFDANRGQPIRLVETGVTTSGGEPPHRCHGVTSMQRYLSNGEICELPHEYCPVCWGEWDFKDRHRTCPSCGVSLGKEVKVMLDSDVCPYCEEGKVTADDPMCGQCGYEVDLSIVTWG